MLDNWTTVPLFFPVEGRARGVYCLPPAVESAEAVSTKQVGGWYLVMKINPRKFGWRIELSRLVWILGIELLRMSMAAAVRIQPV